MRRVFEKGSPVTNEEIQSVVHKLGRTAGMFDIASLDEEYKEFLNIYGPGEFISDNGGKIQEILFKRSLRIVVKGAK